MKDISRACACTVKDGDVMMVSSILQTNNARICAWKGIYIYTILPNVLCVGLCVCVCVYVVDLKNVQNIVCISITMIQSAVVRRNIERENYTYTYECTVPCLARL